MSPEISVYFDLLESRFDYLKEVLDELEEKVAALNWRPADGELSSMFAIIAFTALNVDFWIGHIIGGRTEPPGFDSILEEGRGDNPKLLCQLLDSALETARLTLDGLKAKDLDKVFDYADEYYSARQAILQAIDETARRCGQVEVLREWTKEIKA